MTSIQPQTPAKYKRHSLKVDMTPMVDLGFLLITFFIFTTSMAEPKITKLIMPADGKPSFVEGSKALTVLLDKEKIYIYSGSWDKALATHTIVQVGYDVKTGLGTIIRQKQKQLSAVNAKEDLVFIVKPLPSSTYQNVIAALDEVLINNITHYAFVNVTAENKAMLLAIRYSDKRVVF